VKGTGDATLFMTFGDGSGAGRVLTRDVAGDSGEGGVRGGFGLEIGEPDWSPVTRGSGVTAANWDGGGAGVEEPGWSRAAKLAWLGCGFARGFSCATAVRSKDRAEDIVVSWEMEFDLKNEEPAGCRRYKIKSLAEGEAHYSTK